jgi:hypothetical protein
MLLQIDVHAKPKREEGGAKKELFSIFAGFTLPIFGHTVYNLPFFGLSQHFRLSQRSIIEVRTTFSKIDSHNNGPGIVHF